MPQIREKERERERALCGGLCRRSKSFSVLHSFVPLSFSTKRETKTTLSRSLSLLCDKHERIRERERGDCDGIEPWCWKSGFDEDDEDEDFVGDEKESRGAVDDDDATSFVVFALVFVRSRDSTDG